MRRHQKKEASDGEWLLHLPDAKGPDHRVQPEWLPDACEFNIPELVSWTRSDRDRATEKAITASSFDFQIHLQFDSHFSRSHPSVDFDWPQLASFREASSASRAARFSSMTGSFQETFSYFPDVAMIPLRETSRSTPPAQSGRRTEHSQGENESATRLNRKLGDTHSLQQRKGD